MKFSEKWLREWVDPAMSVDELVEQITMAGLEVDALESVSNDFSGVVVGEIVSVESHPDADKLRVCQVSGGGDSVQVVCGAPNAAVGLKVPFATVGAVLKGSDDKAFKIKAAKLRGVPSNGMLCGASELGMEDQVDGLMELSFDAPVGTNIRDYLSLDDNVIDVDLTPNRGDCLSLLGLAREVGVLNKLDVKLPEFNAVEPSSEKKFPVTVVAPESCPAYLGRVIEGIDISKSTPLWMVEKLRRSGIRSIDAVVDVTNYVLLELGQPMHAFDLDRLCGAINVRLAQEGEKLTLLDDQELELKTDSLVIADDEKALALAGIMGGKDSGVTEKTQNIMLESAFFEPIKIAGRARNFGLHTDSSHRFERGVDYRGQKRAIERATELLLEIVGGTAGPVTEALAEQASDKLVELSAKRLVQVLGLEIAKAEVSEMLIRLGFGVTETEKGWSCVVPSYRFDVEIEADLVEEVARIYGYNNLPTRKLRANVAFVKREEAITPLAKIKQHLIAKDYQEAICYSFIESKAQAVFSDIKPVDVANPISIDMEVMRTSLIPGLLSALQHNINRQISRVRLFESGQTFIPSGEKIIQKEYLAGVIYGQRNVESWSNTADVVDFYDLKGDIEGLLEDCGHDLQEVDFIASSHKGLHPGQCADVMINGVKAGVIGALHPETAKSLTITGSVFVFELSLCSITVGKVPNFKALSKFPQVRRDIALLVGKDITAAAITDVISISVTKAEKILQHCSIFDVYQGDSIESGKKSIAVALQFQHDERSLNDEDVQQQIDLIVAALEKELGAQLRN